MAYLEIAGQVKDCYPKAGRLEIKIRASRIKTLGRIPHWIDLPDKESVGLLLSLLMVAMLHCLRLHTAVGPCWAVTTAEFAKVEKTGDCDCC